MAHVDTRVRVCVCEHVQHLHPIRSPPVRCNVEQTLSWSSAIPGTHTATKIFPSTKTFPLEEDKNSNFVRQRALSDLHRIILNKTQRSLYGASRVVVFSRYNASDTRTQAGYESLRKSLSVHTHVENWPYTSKPSFNARTHTRADKRARECACAHTYTQCTRTQACTHRPRRPPSELPRVHHSPIDPGSSRNRSCNFRPCLHIK